MCKISLLIPWLGPQRGVFTSWLTALACLPWRPAQLRWLQCWVPNVCPLRRAWDWKKACRGFGVFLCWSSMSFSLFLCSSSAVFLWRVSARKQRQCLLEVTEEKCMFFLRCLPFPLHVCVCISLHKPSSLFVNLIFHFLSRSKISVCLPPSSLLSLTGGYAHTLDIPVFFLSAVVLLWIKSVKWKWGLSLSRALPLSPTLSLPLFPDIKTRLCLQCFSQILECCQIL